MRRLVPALLAAALALPAGPALASPYTAHFDAIVLELIARDGALPPSGLTAEQKRQKSALNRSFKFLAANSTGLSGDLAMARKIAGAVEKGFPADGPFAGLLAALDAGLAADIAAERDETVVLISIAESGKLRTRAEAKLAAADALFIAAGEASTSALAARAREKGYRALVQAAVLAVKAGPEDSGSDSTMSAVVAGTPWAANSKFGTGVSGIGEVAAGNSGLRKVLLTGRRILPLSTDDRLPGDTTRIQLSLLSANNDIVPGTYAMGNSNGVNASASWFHEDEDEEVDQAVSLAGTIEVLSLTVRAGSVDIAGTFTLTMYDGLADATFEIASGTFEALGLPRSTVP